MEKFNEKFKQVLFCSVSGRGAAISRFVAGKLARCMRLGGPVLPRSAALAILGSLVFLGLGAAQGQVENGTITGRVTDPSGAVVSGASVTVSQKSYWSVAAWRDEC